MAGAGVGVAVSQQHIRSKWENMYICFVLHVFNGTNPIYKIFYTITVLGSIVRMPTKAILHICMHTVREQRKPLLDFALAKGMTLHSHNAKRSHFQREHCGTCHNTQHV